MHGCRYIFAGGGTGGHIYPALAIAEELLALRPEAQCMFVCSDRPIDRSILSPETLPTASGGAAPVRFVPVPAKPFSLRPLGAFRFLRAWAPSIRIGRRLIAEGRAAGTGAVHVVATGGFVAAPLVQAALAERVPVSLVNLDAVPGKANRWIASRIAGAGTRGRVFSAVPVSAEAPGSAPLGTAVEVVPPIVRRAAAVGLSQAEARRELGLDPARPVLMVTGGSQGAGSINQLMAALAHEQPGALHGWQVLHQTGQDDCRELESMYREVSAAHGTEYRGAVTRFERRIGLWWRAADLCICRAGAGNVAEAWASGTPSVFLPYPWHKDQHQKHNARAQVEAGAAVICTDFVEPTANMREAGGVIVRLLANPAELRKLRDAAARLGPADGAARIAECLAGI